MNRDVKARATLTFEVNMTSPTESEAQDSLHKKALELTLLGYPPLEVESEILHSEPATLKCIPVYVFRCPVFAGRANGGQTEQEDTLYLQVPCGHISLPDEDPRILRLVTRDFGGKSFTHAEVANPQVQPGFVGPMFGGNFVFTSDSRFPASQPIPVHDRYETVEQYCSMLND